MPIVFIPAMMRRLTGDLDRVQVEGDTLRKVVDDLDRRYPGMKELLVDNGRVRPGLQFAVDGVVTAIGLLEKVPENAEVHILPAMGGGSRAPAG